MKPIIFILLFLLINNVFSAEDLPENYGKEYSQEYYENILAKQNNPISERGQDIIASCREELGNSPERCFKTDKIRFSCEQELDITTRNINYCVSRGDQQLTITRSFTIKFMFGSDNKDLKFQKKLKTAFYSATNCVKAFYKREGINFDFDLTEVKDDIYSGKTKKADIKVVERSSKGGAPHRIPLSNVIEYYSHDKLCQIATHELSHHLALPDRYQRYDRGEPCSKQRTYPEETLMAMHGESGFAGFPALRFHEHDFLNMLNYACPNTVQKYMQTSPFGKTEMARETKPKEEKEASFSFTDFIFYLIVAVYLFDLITRIRKK